MLLLRMVYLIMPPALESHEVLGNDGTEGRAMPSELEAALTDSFGPTDAFKDAFMPQVPASSDLAGAGW